MNRLAAAFIACVALPSLAAAQYRGRVYVSGVGEPGAVFEFNPCIPAEGSLCGAWIDHTVDSVALNRQNYIVSGDGRDSLWIDGGTLAIKTTRSSAKPTRIRDSRGAVASIAAASNPRLAYVVLLADASRDSTRPNWVVMIDLDTRSAIASASFRFKPGGIGVVR